MVRTVFISFLLAALVAVSASGSTAHKARAHKSAAAASASHHKAHHPSVRRARRSTRHPKRPAARHATLVKRRSVVHASATRSKPQPLSTPDSDMRAPETPASQPLETPAEPASAPAPVSLRTTRIVPVAPLRGSLESLVRQNQKTEADGLERIEDDADLSDRIARGMLVPVPTSSALTINGNLPQNRRYCRSWTATFLTDLARAHQALFHSPLEVSSAVRTVDYQKRLIGVNGNAAAAEGDVVSPHVTGATIDIAKHGMSAREIYWIRGRLLALQNEGKIDVAEEFQQACFHITVYKSYAPDRPAHTPHTPRRRAATPPEDTSPDSEPAPAGIASRGR
jgi:hypothetical protein